MRFVCLFIPVDLDGWMVRENAKQGREEDVQKRDECLGRAPRKKDHDDCRDQVPKESCERLQAWSGIASALGLLAWCFQKQEAAAADVAE